MTRRRALVTGGSGALGAAISLALGRDGCHVIVHGQDRERTQRVVESVRVAGGSAEAIHFDITQFAQVSAALEPLVEDAPIQVLVHCAGVHHDVPLLGMSEDQWHQVIGVSLDGFYNVTRTLLGPMLRSRWGRIVSLSSISAVLGNRGQVNYAAAKAGLHGATKSLARECASRGITVNAVAPGVIDTQETMAAFPPERLAAMVPMNRPGTVDEVADLVAFLASDRASYITGQIVCFDGGAS